MAAPETELSALYRGVMGRLTGLLKVVRSAGGVSPGNRPFVTTQLRRLDADLQKIQSLEGEVVRKVIAPLFTRSMDQADASIRLAGYQITQATQTGLEVQTLRQLEVRLTRDLRAVRLALGTALALNDPVRQGPAAVARALEADGAVQIVKGEAKVRTPSGKMWGLDGYATMLTRTAAADARREAFRTRYLSNGLDVVYVIPNGTDHAVCAAWEGVLLSLTGATPGLATVDDARSAGLFHPNCRHRYVAATPEHLDRAGLEIAPLPRVSVREGLNRVQPTVPLPTLGRAAPGAPGRPPAPTAVPNPKQPSLRSVSPELLRASRRVR